MRLTRSYALVAVLIAAAGLSGLLIANHLRADEKIQAVSYMPAETDLVLANPYMGFAIDAKYDNAVQPFRLAHANLSWRELEPEKGKYAFDAVEKRFNFALWKQRGVHLILRVILDYPREQSHMDIPDWLYEEIGRSGKWYDSDYGKGFSPDYCHPALIQNHERLLNALGERYNQDPLIAFIQLGSLGHWGEWHTRDDDQGFIPFPKQNISDQYAEHYVRAFPDKHLLMRRPHQVALDHKMGLYNDAFGKSKSTIDGFLKWYTEGYKSWLTDEDEPAMPDFWATSPSGGEFSSGSYFKDSVIEETLRQARLTHVTWMGPSAPYREKDAAIQPNIDRFLKTIGYRFVLTKETHEKEAAAGKSLHISLAVNNRGVAPFYYNWPLELSLADGQGTIVAAVRTDIDIRKWLPGEHEASYALPIPDHLQEGVYTVNAAILDPQSGKPGVEFAIDGKRADGRYALGTVLIKPAKK